MKKSFVFAIIIMVCTILLSSCSDHEMPSTDITSNILTNDSDGSKGQSNIIKFDSRASFDYVLGQLSKLSSDEEKEEWVKAHYPSLHSIYNLYWEAMEEMASIAGDTEEDMRIFQTKYKSLYFPCYLDDAGFYIPLSNLDIAFIANDECCVAIDGEIINLRDINTYDQLKGLGRALYSEINLETRATMAEFSLSNTAMDPVGPEYDSGWTEYKGNDGKDYKVKLKARRKFTTYAPVPGSTGSQSWFHLEFCYRKKTWLGWSNYKSRSTINFTATVPGFGNIVAGPFENHANSSHDDEFLYPIHIFSENNYTYYTFVQAQCNTRVLFKELDSSELVYNWSMSGCQAKTPWTPNPVVIVPKY